MVSRLLPSTLPFRYIADLAPAENELLLVEKRRRVSSKPSLPSDGRIELLPACEKLSAYSTTPAAVIGRSAGTKETLASPKTPLADTRNFTSPGSAGESKRS